MRFKPVNPNPDLEPRHAFIMACTGSGKSQLLKTLVPTGPDVRVVGYDDVGAVPGLYYSSRKGFLAALKAGVSRGRGFRVFYAGLQTPEDYCWWCEVVWSILDGNHLTYAITEEAAAVSAHAGTAPEPVSLMMNQGRKYGLIHIGTTQRPQAVHKTYTSQSRIKYAGQQDMADVRMMSRLVGVTEQQITQLQPLQFYRSEGMAGGGQLIQVPYRKRKGIVWKD